MRLRWLLSKVRRMPLPGYCRDMSRSELAAAYPQANQHELHLISGIFTQTYLVSGSALIIWFTELKARQGCDYPGWLNVRLDTEGEVAALHSGGASAGQLALQDCRVGTDDRQPVLLSEPPASRSVRHCHRTGWWAQAYVLAACCADNTKSLFIRAFC